MRREGLGRPGSFSIRCRHRARIREKARERSQFLVERGRLQIPGGRTFLSALILRSVSGRTGMSAPRVQSNTGWNNTSDRQAGTWPGGARPGLTEAGYKKRANEANRGGPSRGDSRKSARTKPIAGGRRARNREKARERSQSRGVLKFSTTGFFAPEETRYPVDDRRSESRERGPSGGRSFSPGGAVVNSRGRQPLDFQGVARLSHEPRWGDRNYDPNWVSVEPRGFPDQGSVGLGLPGVGAPGY